MSAGSSAPWPPPPDLASLKELFATADVEGLIADGAPLDEYDPEAKNFFAAIAEYPVERIIAANLMPTLEAIWAHAFALDAEQLAKRRPALASLADQIARFFGPEAQPQTRSSV